MGAKVRTPLNHTVVTLGLGCLVLATLTGPGCQRETGIAEGPVEVLDKPCPRTYSGCKSTKVIATLKADEQVEVLGVEDIKNEFLYKVRLADGRVGFVQSYPNFRVEKRK